MCILRALDELVVADDPDLGRLFCPDLPRVNKARPANRTCAFVTLRQRLCQRNYRNSEVITLICHS